MINEDKSSEGSEMKTKKCLKKDEQEAETDVALWKRALIRQFAWKQLFDSGPTNRGRSTTIQSNEFQILFCFGFIYR